MAASALSDPAMLGGGPRRRSVFTFGRVISGVAIALALVLAWNFLGRVTVSERPNETKMTAVVIPPPPPPPPPPEPEKIEKPPEPTIAPPLEQPLDTPPPPEQASSDPAPGDSALSAREGAGPSNYGLAVGDGGGTRIGGRPGGNDGFAAYGELTRREVSAALQRGGRDLGRGSYSVQLLVAVDAEGRITDARVLRSSGDTRRDDAIQRMLIGHQLSQQPPAGLPVMRLNINARSGA